MTLLTGWRYVCFVGVIVGGTAAALYPIVIQPMIDPGYYSKFLCNQNIYEKLYFWTMFAERLQKQNRAGVRQEDVQPGSKCFQIELSCPYWFISVVLDMKVWSDPFDRKADDRQQ